MSPTPAGANYITARPLGLVRSPRRLSRGFDVKVACVSDDNSKLYAYTGVAGQKTSHPLLVRAAGG
jgi:hypothetical protein